MSHIESYIRQVLDRLKVHYYEKGNRLALHCPFHDDRDPSAAFYLDTGLFHCFSDEITTDLTGFYARFNHISRSQAEKDLERGIGLEPLPKREIDVLYLGRARQWGERHLRSLRTLPRREHALRGETLDRILLAYERGQIDERKFDKLLKIWYNDDEEFENGFYHPRTAGPSPDDRLQERPGHLPGSGRPGTGDPLDDERAEDAPELA